MTVSLQHTPPEDVLEIMTLRSESLLEKMYSAKGLSLLSKNIIKFKTKSLRHPETYIELMNFMASKALSMFMIGRTGPKISSFMTASVGFTSTRIVGSMYLSLESVLPPTATFPSFKKLVMRLDMKK